MMIRLFVFDVDGTLTDGRIHIGPDGEVFKSFDVKDGYAIAHLPDRNIKSAIITGRTSKIVAQRSAELHIPYVYQGVSDKKATLISLIEELGMSKDEVCYIGDDLNDYDCMNAVGHPCCPNDAVDEIRSVCEYISPKNGGRGAVRDIIDHMLSCQNRDDRLRPQV